MKTVYRFRSRVRILASALLAAWFAGLCEGHAQLPSAQLPGGLTCPKLPPEGHVTSNPIACTVSCANGGKVTSALALAPRTTAGLTIATVKAMYSVAFAPELLAVFVEGYRKAGLLER